MVPYSERRHRLNAIEIIPVKNACCNRLLQLLRDRNPEALLEAIALFRVWYRIEHYVRNKPKYPPHNSFEQIASGLNYGTESTVIEKAEKGAFLRGPDRGGS